MDIDLGISVWINNIRTRLAGGNPSTGDMIISTKNLITLMEDLRDKQRSGIDIERTLWKVGDSFHNKQVANLFKIIHKRLINGGESLSESMSKFPVAFPKYLVALIAACEGSGNWTSTQLSNGKVEPGILDLLISLLKRSNTAKRKLIAGMIYPAVIIAALVGTIAIFSFTILPTIKDVFVALQVFDSMNFLSRGLFTVGEYFQVNYHLIPFVLLGFIVLVKILWDFQLKKLWLYYQIRIKVIGNIFINMFIAENFMLLGVLYNAGLNVTDCLAIMSKSCVNKEIAAGFEKARTFIRTEGIALSEALKKSHFAFNDELIYRISTAEETGRIDEAMIDYANQLFERLDEQIEAFVKMIEPAMIGIGGVLVGLLAISFYGSISSALANIR